MKSRRHFLKTTALITAGVAVSGNVLAGNGKKQKINNLQGLIYTKENQGMWKNKAASHVPEVTVEGNKVKLFTDHGMSEKHYIVRHTLVDAKGNVLGAKTFYPVDEPKSEFELPAGFKGKLYATSFCNKHDFWINEFDV